MMFDKLNVRKRQSDLKEALRLFAKDESGIIPVTILGCFMVLIMIGVGGIGVDLMRQEMERTRLQAVADRAVLAAANLDQSFDSRVPNPEAVVRDYFDKAGMADYVSSVSIDQGLNYRTVTVDATTTMNTQFMGNLGVPTLTIPARSTAEERVNKVEISLVLDVSGSMDTGSKMDDLQEAAGSFVDTVLDPSNAGLISVSLIPYSQHVNAGEKITDLLNVNILHHYSHCVEFDDSDFDSVVLNTSKTYEQMQHFQWNYTSIQSGGQLNTLYDTICPREEYEEITPFSQNPTTLKTQINSLQPRAGTQIFYGMKWAAAMLDPSFRPLTQSLASDNHVDAVFADRPSAYTDDETLKTIVLMTDGQNSSTVRIADRYYNTVSLYNHWDQWNFQYYLYNIVRRNYGSWYYTKYTADDSDSLLYNICDAAKEEHIVIWTIGFEVLDHGAEVMENCASSPSHFFRVTGADEISGAFDAIARQINQLRLTQ